MPLVVIQTTIPDSNGKPFRVTEVLERVATNADEALRAAIAHIGDECDAERESLTARWHDKGGYWLVAWQPFDEIQMGRPLLLV